jgi:FkbM family methyltransferase
MDQRLCRDEEFMIRSAVSIIPWGLRPYIRSTPVLAQGLRWLATKALDGREFVHRVDAGPAKGVRFWIRMPEDKGIWTGAYERRFAEQLASAMQPGWVGYDIGGWHGFFTGVMAARNARRVVVFEPLPANIARIEHLIALNPSLPIEIQPLALGAAEGTAELLIMPETSMAKLTQSEFRPEAPAINRITVRISTLDALVYSGILPPPNLIKLDVEGAEMLVLSGAERVLAQHRPAIFAEVHSSELLRRVSALLGSQGYSVTQIDQDEPLVASGDVMKIQAVWGGMKAQSAVAVRSWL